MRGLIILAGVFDNSAGQAPSPPCEQRSSLWMLIRALLLLLLVCAQPFLAFTARNLDEGLAFGDVAPWFAAAFALAAASYGLLHAWLRPRSLRPACVVAVLVFVVFRYHDVCTAFERLGASPRLQALGFLLVLALGLAAAAWLGARRAFQQFLFLFSAGLLVLPAVDLARHEPGGARPGEPAAARFPLPGNDVWSGTPVRTPNVYWIVADSYPSLAQLRDAYGFDGRPFVAFLESQGFLVAPRSYANFNITRLSVPSTLDMQYEFDEGERYATRGRGNVWSRGRTHRSITDAVAGDNRAVAWLQQVGYRYVHFDAGIYGLFRCRGYEDVCLTSGSHGPTEIESALLALVPADLPERLSGAGRSDAALPRPRRSAGTGIPELGEAVAGLRARAPYFLYAHFNAPHPPFVVDARCRPRPPLGFATRDRAAFVEQLRCVNRQLRALVDRIVAVDPEAIVIVAGDHGPRFSVEPETRLADLTPEQIRESLGILQALRLPAACRDGFRPDLAPVNSLRLVFACLAGQAPRWLEQRYFVTAEIRSPDFGQLRRVDPLAAEHAP